MSRCRRDEPKVTVQHLVCASIAHGLRCVPEANARVVRNRIVSLTEIAMAMPVNLLGHPGGKERELGLMMLRSLESKTLIQIAEELSQTKRVKTTNPTI